MNVKKDIYVLDNELLSIQRKLTRLLGEVEKLESKIRWVIQKKTELNYRVYEFTKEYGSFVVRVIPDTTLIRLEQKLTELLAMVNQLRLDVEWLDRSFSESVKDNV